MPRAHGRRGGVRRPGALRARRHYYRPTYAAQRFWRPNYWGLPVYSYHHFAPHNVLETPEKDLRVVDEPHWSAQPSALLLMVLLALIAGALLRGN